MGNKNINININNSIIYLIKIAFLFTKNPKIRLKMDDAMHPRTQISNKLQKVSNL